MTSKKSTGAILFVGPPADTAWIRYLSGFEAPDPVYALYRAGTIHLVVSPLEAGRAQGCRGQARSLQVHTAASLGLSGVGGREPMSAVLRLLEKNRIDAVAVGRWFPADAARRLESKGIRVELPAGSLLKGREIKSAEECQWIRRAQQAAVTSMRGAIAMIAAARIDRRGFLRHGQGRLTSDAVRGRIEQGLIECGCRGDGVIVAGGRQAADPHERGHGPLRAREAIVLDIFPRHVRSGYWGDLTRTVIRGPVPDRLRAMYVAVDAARSAALQRIKPGTAVRTVHRAAAGELLRHGFVTRLNTWPPEGFIHGTGHGVGLEIHEPPSLRDAPGRLRAGHVVTVEPGVYYAATGGVRIEDTVEVTPEGARILAPMPRVFGLDV